MAHLKHIYGPLRDIDTGCLSRKARFHASCSNQGAAPVYETVGHVPIPLMYALQVKSSGPIATVGGLYDSPFGARE